MNLVRKIGIFYIHEQWVMQYLENMLKSISPDIISEKRIRRNDEKQIIFKNGDSIRCVRASENSRGYKFDTIIEEPNIDMRIHDTIIRPCLVSPIKVGQIDEPWFSANAAIEQRLPRSRKVSQN